MQLGLRRARRRWRWRRARRGDRSHGRWRPPRGRKDRSIARLRQGCERDRPERIALHRLPLDRRGRSRRRTDGRCRSCGNFRKRAVRRRHDVGWRVGIRKIRRQRKARRGSGEQRRQHGHEPCRDPSYRPMCPHVPRHQPIASSARFSVAESWRPAYAGQAAPREARLIGYRCDSRTKRRLPARGFNGLSGLQRAHG